MNKKIITASAASLVLAAMPVVGAFAAEEVTDEIKVTISEACTIADKTGKTGDAAVTTTIAPGVTSNDLSGSEISISCNATTGWQLTAKGDGTEGHTTELWNETASKGIPTISGNSVVNGTNAWGFKVSGTGTETAYNADYVAVPSDAEIVAQGDGVVYDTPISTSYKVSNAGDLPTGTYIGKVIYTLSKKN